MPIDGDSVSIRPAVFEEDNTWEIFNKKTQSSEAFSVDGNPSISEPSDRAAKNIAKVKRVYHGKVRSTKIKELKDATSVRLGDTIRAVKFTKSPEATLSIVGNSKVYIDGYGNTVVSPSNGVSHSEHVIVSVHRPTKEADRKRKFSRENSKIYR